MASQAPSNATTAGTKRPLEERSAGLDQLVKDLSGTGITRTALPTPTLKTHDFLKQSLYGSTSGMTRLQNVHSIFAAGLERRRRAAQLGYGDDATPSWEPPVKRRRFQRRNSKTPAMLFKSMNFLPQDLFDEKKAAPAAPVRPKSPVVKHDDDEDWDGGLEIAEQLVKHLQQKRRLSDVSAH